jgi:hypothetical protein
MTLLELEFLILKSVEKSLLAAKFILVSVSPCPFRAENKGTSRNLFGFEN